MYIRHAHAKGVTIVINPDAHSVRGFANLDYGIGVARRAGLTAKDVPNAHTPAEVDRVLKTMRSRPR